MSSHFAQLGSLPCAYGGPAGTATLRAQPEDFQVNEWLGYEADGEGDHLLLRVRKRDANTLWVAKQLARAGKLGARDVGFAGLKDRQALVEQSFTVPRRNARGEDWVGVCGSGFEVIASARHRRKLKRGALRGNQFVLTLRDFAGDLDLLQQRLSELERQGAPNYFGPQRFGRGYGNLELARRWFTEGAPPADRFERSFALSAARAAIFNAVLAERIAAGTWNRLLPGELANLDGTNSYFSVLSLDEELVRRCAELDIHPTGPLWSGHSTAAGESARSEEAIAAQFPALARGLADAAMEPQRRPLRMRVQDLRWAIEGTQIRLEFRLRRGSFATAVLHEIIDSAAMTEVPDGDDLTTSEYV